MAEDMKRVRVAEDRVAGLRPAGEDGQVRPFAITDNRTVRPMQPARAAERVAVQVVQQLRGGDRQRRVADMPTDAPVHRFSPRAGRSGRGHTGAGVGVSMRTRLAEIGRAGYEGDL